ncbi:hypothetical protein G4G28_10485 [Massilia sp. Dwa41.01b]|uniref:hypothetical protein n=1 Tax=unclassified Massilia TaxID=2609279 RepID=UPI0015FEDF22|nr:MULTISPECIES: hypothetical protein [unclassified Massilia]QNA88809.1 hypothetical protein G4G28_10485 [Massilia sp. Dwa41.01b]QNA99706.1 hypothetical protein G4G31_14140 [Massilia sp. Se16.2.3]
MKQLEKMYADLPEIIEKEDLAQHSKEEFGLVCSNFPAILEQERWDFEKYHAHELATVRRGPPR